jgi:hypothetical protein
MIKTVFHGLLAGVPKLLVACLIRSGAFPYIRKEHFFRFSCVCEGIAYSGIKFVAGGVFKFDTGQLLLVAS